MTPSGKALARSMASYVDPDGDGPVVELMELTMRNLPTNQDGCKAKTLALTYSGTATN